jgi:hypothetical protein
MSLQRKGRRARPQSLGFHDLDGRRGDPRRQAIGATDEIGLRAAGNRIMCTISTHDPAYAGLNHLNLTYLHNGRSERPTINSGKLIQEALA